VLGAQRRVQDIQRPPIELSHQLADELQLATLGPEIGDALRVTNRIF
jgi:hypothetical protein